MFLSHLTIKPPIAKIIDNNIFEGTYEISICFVKTVLYLFLKSNTKSYNNTIDNQFMKP